MVVFFIKLYIFIHAFFFRYTAQREAAKKLASESGVPFQGPHGLGHITLIEQFLSPQYSIDVWSLNQGLPFVISKGNREYQHKINILLEHNHAHLILSMPALLSNSYYCHHCYKGYSNKAEHRCEHLCDNCRAPGKCPKGAFPFNFYPFFLTGMVHFYIFRYQNPV